MYIRRNYDQKQVYVFPWTRCRRRHWQRLYSKSYSKDV